MEVYFELINDAAGIKKVFDDLSNEEFLGFDTETTELDPYEGNIRLVQLSNGKPVSSTYLGLWCETWDNSMVNVSKANDMAHAAGFNGQRAAYTWSGRIKILQDLRFIDVKPGRSGPNSHILIWNPHRIIRWHHSQKTPGLVEAHFNALMERALEIGAGDMFDEIPVSVEAPAPPPSPPSASQSVSA